VRAAPHAFERDDAAGPQVLDVDFRPELPEQPTGRSGRPPDATSNSSGPVLTAATRPAIASSGGFQRDGSNHSEYGECSHAPGTRMVG